MAKASGARNAAAPLAGGLGPRAIVRAAVAADDAAIADLRRQADRAHAQLLPDFFRSPPPDWSPPLLAGPDSVVLVAALAGCVVGYVAARVADTPSSPSMTPCRRAYVDTIVVDEAHRHRGVGTALMRAAGDWARRREAVEILLTVWADNRAAEALYRSLDFAPVARVLRRAL